MGHSQKLRPMASYLSLIVRLRGWAVLEVRVASPCSAVQEVLLQLH